MKIKIPTRTCLTCLLELNRGLSIARSSLMIVCFAGLILAGTTPGVAQETGQISGSVTEMGFDAMVRGVEVKIVGNAVTTTDLEGRYILKDLNPGYYDIQFFKQGYQRVMVESIEVKAGETTKLDFKLQTTFSDIVEMKELIIDAEVLMDSELGMLEMRQTEIRASDAISAEQMERFGASDAAQAMSKVTGASVREGKYVFIRGLGERYSNTMLNGATMPSNDPNKKAVQMDLFPAGMLESIVTSKTFTPDKPGDFTGGSVDVKTKSFPDQPTFNLKFSSSFNSQAAFEDDFLSYDGGDHEWLGFDDGTRELPQEYTDNFQDLPTGRVQTDEQAQLIDLVTESFTPVLAPRTEEPEIGSSFALNFGRAFEWKGKDVGVFASFNYDRDFNYYDGGINARYLRNVSNTQQLQFVQDFEDTKASVNVLWGALFSAAIKPSASHELNFNFIYNKGSDDTARFQQGLRDKSEGFGDIFQIRTLHFIERDLTSFQLQGEHQLDFIQDGMRLDWMASYSTTGQEEPDVRFFNNVFNPNTQEYAIFGTDQEPRRLWRDLEETKPSFTIDFTQPLSFMGRDKSKLKIGYYLHNTERDFSEQIISYNYVRGRSIVPLIPYDGNDQNFLAPENTGFIGGSDSQLGLVVQPFDKNAYQGFETVNAFYLMGNFFLGDKWRVIAGGRYEDTDISILQTESSRPPVLPGFTGESEIKDSNWLPSFNLIYSLSDDSNVRGSITKTLARPTFRELSPHFAFEYLGGETFVGNQELEMTSVTNYDIRWEKFPNPGELISAGFFFKNLSNPIELSLSLFADNFFEKPLNVDKATVWGLELEYRKSLESLGGIFAYLSINSNFTYIKSEVDISPAEIEAKQPFFGSAADVPVTRQLAGQPDYITNIGLSYDNYERGTSLSINFNLVSDQLDRVSYAGTPDVIEDAASSLDIIFSQRLWYNWEVGLKARNLINPSYERYYDSTEREIYTSFKRGRTFDVGLTYSF